MLTDERRQWQMLTALELNKERTSMLTIAKTIGMKTAATERLIQAASQLRDIAGRYPPNVPALAQSGGEKTKPKEKTNE